MTLSMVIMVAKELIAAKVINFVIYEKMSLRQAMKVVIKQNYVNKCSPEERASIHALAFETIRSLNLINHIINNKLNIDALYKKEKSKNQNFNLIICILRISIYRMLFEKHPAPYVTNTTIKLMKSLGYPMIGAYVNKIFRKIEHLEIKNYLENIKDPTERIALQYLHSYWLISTLSYQMSENELIKILESNNKASATYIRLNHLRKEFKDINTLSEEGIEFEEDRNYSDILKILSTKIPLTYYESYKKGYFFIQSRSSAIVAYVLGSKQGEFILDACAAPGGKTTQIASMTRDKAMITAVEIKAIRMNELKRNLEKYNVKNVKTILGDVKNLDDKYIEYFDRILLDAPCTGSGTYNSRPEGKWRVSRKKVRYYTKIQQSLLKSVSKYVKKGGYIAYSTCSIIPHENEAIIEKFLLENTEFSLNEIFIPESIPILEKGRRIYPYIGDSEGFSIFLIKRELSDLSK